MRVLEKKPKQQEPGPERIKENPELQMTLFTAFMGPEAIDAKYFEPGFQERLFA